jgi:N-acetylglucosaminyldiphosphoundecaprenol N-acetyl-beta-D-mannosaminyltransferase
MSEYCEVCGLPISRRSMKQTLDLLLERISQGEGAWLLTLNTEMLARFARDPHYRELIAQADIITADGMPLVWASRFRGPHQDISERTTGVDLVDAFLRLPQVPPFAIIGGVDPATTVARYGDAATHACRYLYTGQVDLSEQQLQQFVDAMRAEQVNLLFAALGVPKQDKLALKMRTMMPELVIAGIGGTFEILGPQGSRAPLWMQRTGTEWLFRLVKEPGRLWKRYLVQYPAGVSLLIKDTMRARATSRRQI